MITASCHGGAVRYTLQNAPEMVLDCTCSNSWLWACYPQREASPDVAATLPSYRCHCSMR